jgi:cyclopropane fatty-acyl-phospholipid synthase-like methyltransferase
MLYRPSNRARARWAVSLLDVQPGDDVLDIGIGPGYSTGLIAARPRTGRLVGIDRSKLMVDMAARRLRRSLRTGAVTLIRADVRPLPRFDVSFDKVLAINVAQFLGEDLGTVLALLRTRMTRGGRIALAVQPRERGATAAAAQLEGSRLAAALEAAGFKRTESTFNASLGKVPAVCVVAHA